MRYSFTRYLIARYAEMARSGLKSRAELKIVIMWKLSSIDTQGNVCVRSAGVYGVTSIYEM